jgi:hypothetical protein
MRRFSGSSVLSSSHCVRKEGLLRRLTMLRLRKIGRASLEVASQVVLLEEEVDVYSPPAGIENRLRDGLRIELLTAMSREFFAPAMKATMTASRLSAAPNSIGPTKASILPSAKVATAVLP